MRREIFLYALSTGINKGSTLLFFPFLVQLLSLEDFGRWSLVVVVSNLLIPIISLNGSSGILREGSEDLRAGYNLLYLFTVITISIGILSFFFLRALDVSYWITFSVMIASAESVLLLELTIIRVQERSKFYLLLNLLKVVSLFLLILYGMKNNFDLQTLLLYHFLIVTIVAIIVFILIWPFYTNSHIIFFPVFSFSLSLIPHAVSQWLMSSSDRIIIEYVLGTTSVGIYSLAYNIAMVLMLVNSGIALALPPYIIKDYKGWIEKKLEEKMINYYTLVSMGLFFISLGAYTVDYHFFKVLGHYSSEMIPLISLIYVGIYFLGIYYFFANHLFYHRKTGIISLITFKASILNVVLAIILVFQYQLIGAAIATFISYLYYMISVIRMSKIYEKNIQVALAKPIGTFLVWVIILSCGFYNVF